MQRVALKHSLSSTALQEGSRCVFVPGNEPNVMLLVGLVSGALPALNYILHVLNCIAGGQPLRVCAWPQ
jgi:hypothetical protein